MKKIIVPIDGSKYADLAVGKAREFAETFDCKVVLLHVYDLQGLYMKFQLTPRSRPADLDKPQKDSRALLEAARQSLEELGDRVETVSLEGDPADTILEYIEHREMDMVIMGSHGVKGMKRVLIGSVTNKVIHHTDKPVLIVR
ncbi:universal stress protein [Anaerotalea alkaliphila]|uniref:Universal stress protein n=1 Tax=Anaerotalea alkaliphila TaxID=2662126 RepID=A0A7X5KME0_9FIRM|nr:universal stress protein [Anaerotalea alkaliphila]NDL66854.1 universal stress protein [Anaerotalea alkaliphila]